MPEPEPPRRPPFGWGKGLPPAAKPAPPPPADAGFEVVEEEAPGFEVIDEAAPPPGGPARPAAKVSVSQPTPPPQPALKPLRAEAEEEGPRRPKKPKRKKKQRVIEPVDDDQAARDQALAEFEWIWPGVLLAFGMILTFVGAFGAAGPVGAFYTIGVLVFGLFVSVPVTVAALMLVGILAGIEYGRFGPAVLKIAAITFMVNGVYFIGAWAKLPFFVVVPVACAVSFALFMAQFELDTWETNASVGAINAMSFVAKVVLIGFLVVAEARSDRDRGGSSEPDDDPPPSEVRPNRKPPRGGDTSIPPPKQPQPGDDDDGDR